MQSQPMVTVKTAAMLLGVEKERIREKLREGCIKGERRQVGSKERWFVHSGEIDFLMNTGRHEEVFGRKERTSLEGLNEFFDEASVEKALEEELDEQNEAAHETHQNKTKKIKSKASRTQVASPTPDVYFEISDSDDALPEPSSVHENLPAAYNHIPSIDQVIHSLTVQFAHRLAEERQLIYKLEFELHEKSAMANQIAPLEQALQAEVRISSVKDEQIKTLQQEVALLSTQMKDKQSSLWTRFVSWLKGPQQQVQ